MPSSLLKGTPARFYSLQIQRFRSQALRNNSQATGKNSQAKIKKTLSQTLSQTLSLSAICRHRPYERMVADTREAPRTPARGSSIGLEARQATGSVDELRHDVLALCVVATVICACTSAWVLWRLLRPPSPSKPRGPAPQQAAKSPRDGRAAPAAAASFISPRSRASSRQQLRGVRDEPARRSRDPAAVGEHNRPAIAEAHELKRNDVETVQSTIKRDCSLRCRTRSRSRDPDGDTQKLLGASMMTYHHMLLHGPQESPSSAPPSLSPTRGTTAAKPTQVVTQPAPADLEPTALPAGAARASARTNTFERMMKNTMPDALPTPMGFRSLRVPRAGSGEPVGHTASPSGSGHGQAAGDGLCFKFRRTEQQRRNQSTQQDTTRRPPLGPQPGRDGGEQGPHVGRASAKEGNAVCPEEQAQGQARRWRSRPGKHSRVRQPRLVLDDSASSGSSAGSSARALSPARPVDAGEVLANRYKAACRARQQPARPVVSDLLEVDAGEVLANRYKAVWGML